MEAKLPSLPQSQTTSNEEIRVPDIQVPDVNSTTRETTTTTTQDEMNVVDYSDKSFAVYGNATKTYRNQMKALGGRFNKYLKKDGETFAGWIFPLKRKEAVMEFVLSYNENGTVPSVPQNDQTTLPTVRAPTNTSNSTFQYVKFKIFRPKENMKVRLTTGGKTVEGTVIKTENTKDIVDTVYVDFDGQTSLGVICRGKWTIFGLFAPHTVYFSN